jgi:hypothetical protein
MKTSDFIKDADHESNLGVSDTASDLAIRLNPAEAEKATDVVKKIIEDETSTSLSELVHDEAKLLSSLDEYAINLVIHSVAKSIDINSDLCDVLFKHDSNLLIYQDQELNTPLHYLAERGLDLFGKVPMRWLLIRNRKGATVLHILAKNKSIADKVLALPPSILAMKTKNKISIQDTVVNQKKDIDLATINKALKTAVARAPSTNEDRHYDASSIAKQVHKVLSEIDASPEGISDKTIVFHKGMMKCNAVDDELKLDDAIKPLLHLATIETCGQLNFGTISDLFYYLLPQYVRGIYMHHMDDHACIVDNPRKGHIGEISTTSTIVDSYFFQHNDPVKTAVARATLNSTKTMVFTSFDGWYAVLEANPNELQHAINYTSGLIVDLFNRLTNS